MLGLFEEDAHYEEFITQGAKKYAYTYYKKNDKIKETDNVIKKLDDKSLVLGITVAGVPKQGARALKSLYDFHDDFVFDYEYTNKNLIVYTENQKNVTMTDYQCNIYNVTDKSGCCLLPTTYKLGKSQDYINLLTDNSSRRARYNEGGTN